MESENVTRAIVLDARYKHKDDRYPVKLRLTNRRKSQYFTVSVGGEKISLTKPEYAATQTARPRGDARRLADAFAASLLKAKEILEDLPAFSFAAFRRRWDSPLSERTNVFTWFSEKIKDCQKNRQIGTRETYEDARDAFMAFTGKKYLDLRDIDPHFLQRYERWNAEHGNASSTAAIYLRCLRHVYRRAMKDGAIPAALYPFGPGLYVIPESRNQKRPLDEGELLRLWEYQDKDPGSLRQYARDIWALSYLCQGLNPADLFRLRWPDIDNWKATIERQKTRGRRRRSAGAIHLTFSEPARVIIQRWGTDPALGGYIFPVLQAGLDEEQQRKAVKNETRKINRQLGYIAEAVGIRRVTTIWARHTFASTLDSMGVHLSTIQRALGHGDIRTTQNYIGGHVRQESEDIAGRLLERLERDQPEEGKGSRATDK